MNVSVFVLLTQTEITLLFK